jgi:hypothetical protein
LKVLDTPGNQRELGLGVGQEPLELGLVESAEEVVAHLGLHLKPLTGT